MVVDRPRLKRTQFGVDAISSVLTRSRRGFDRRPGC